MFGCLFGCHIVSCKLYVLILSPIDDKFWSKKSWISDVSKTNLRTGESIVSLQMITSAVVKYFHNIDLSKSTKNVVWFVKNLDIYDSIKVKLLLVSVKHRWCPFVPFKACRVKTGCPLWGSWRTLLTAQTPMSSIHSGILWTQPCAWIDIKKS